MSYNHDEIDKKWQARWEEQQAFVAEDFSEKPKFYALDMFPYPSGKGLHVGHMASYTPTDVVARYKRQKGFNVLHPLGYDAFGLPAEQHAIQTGVHPEKTTQEAIVNFRRQLKSFGFSFDWTREISTCDPGFYKWTQWIFAQLFEKGLAYQKEVPVNWCPELKTVLANEEVVDGKSERGGHPVVQKPMKQWMLKITDYADRLIDDLNKNRWPHRTKEGQKNWIGRSFGADIQFQVQGHDLSFSVFTTRPDTLFGVTFMVLSPEHPLVSLITTDSQKKEVEDYVLQAAKKSELDRKADKEKSGAFTGAYALHPLSQKPLPIWIADYVLMGYGSGAIMAVPGHDERDFEFAGQYNLPIVRVVADLATTTDQGLTPGDSSEPNPPQKPQASPAVDSPLNSAENKGLPFIGNGTLVNSDFLNGLQKDEAITKVIEELEKRGLGQKTLQFKLRDWLFSRQRYWGEPFPILHTNEGPKALPLEELPVTLPEVSNYEPDSEGNPPLARAEDWLKYSSPALGQGQRETDTMPGTAGSAWYFLRYLDPNNEKAFVDFEKQKYWMPVDLYVGGPEHTVSHLLYCRFWQKVLFDLGLVSHEEPVDVLAHQGMILGADGEKMSKSKGNVVNPDDVTQEVGADALRCFILFLGPMDRDKPWNPSGINGVRKFLDRVWRLCVSPDGEFLGTSETPSEDIENAIHKTAQKVGQDIESLSFNTAISALMILVNEFNKEKVSSASALKRLVLCLAPFAPHLCEEIWSIAGETSLCSNAPWPKIDPKRLEDDRVSMGVQVNGKKRGSIEISKNASEDEAVQSAKAVTAVANALINKKVVKVIYKAGRILNLIVKP